MSLVGTRMAIVLLPSAPRRQEKPRPLRSRLHTGVFPSQSWREAVVAFGSQDSQSMGNRSNFWGRGPWSLEMSSLSLDRLSMSGCPPSVGPRDSGASERVALRLFNCGAPRGYTGYSWREALRKWLEGRRVATGAWWWSSPQGLALSDGRDRLMTTARTASTTQVPSATASRIKSTPNWSLEIQILPLRDPDKGARRVDNSQSRTGTATRTRPHQDRFPLGVMDPRTPFPPETQAQHL